MSCELALSFKTSVIPACARIHLQTPINLFFLLLGPGEAIRSTL